MATITHPTGNGYCRDRILLVELARPSLSGTEGGKGKGRSSKSSDQFTPAN